MIRVEAVVWGATESDQQEALTKVRTDAWIYGAYLRAEHIRMLNGRIRPAELSERTDALSRAKSYGWEWAIYPLSKPK